ncbi:MAG: FAD-dependent oxidoreductase [Planctomycetes bacterium]|nr:FAD-dependent oxidoreductase [Planctomycetota bacterium]
MRELACDLLVVGAGPAGIAAACAAAERGKKVLVLDENPGAGGQIWRAGTHAPPRAAEPWLARFRASGAELRSGCAVVEGDAARQTLWAQDAEGLLRTRAESIVLATGARELFLPFPGWTLPGVLGAGGLQALAKSGWPVRGKKIGVAGSGPLLLAVAAWLVEHGAHVAFVAEQAPLGRLARFAASLAFQPRKLAQLAALRWKLRGVPQLFSSWPVRANGRAHIDSVELATDGEPQGFLVDALAVGFGLVPETALAEQLGCALDASGAVAVDAEQRTNVERIYAAGEPTGIGGVENALLQGELAGASAAGDARAAHTFARRAARARRFGRALERAFALREELREMPDDDTIVCRCEDVRWDAARELDSARETKLQTRCGMGPCQGRVCQPALHFLKGGRADRRRPPLLPLTLGELAELAADRTTLEHETSR